jgi:hypothetical protein
MENRSSVSTNSSPPRAPQRAAVISGDERKGVTPIRASQKKPAPPPKAKPDDDKAQQH